MSRQTIVGIGGFPNEPMLEYVLGLARGRRLLPVPTAQMEDPASTRDGLRYRVDRGGEARLEARQLR